MAEAQELCAGADLLLCVGSSLEVYPVAGLPELTLGAGGRLAIVTQGPTPVRRRGGGEARRRRRSTSSRRCSRRSRRGLGARHQAPTDYAGSGRRGASDSAPPGCARLPTSAPGALTVRVVSAQRRAAPQDALAERQRLAAARRPRSTPAALGAELAAERLVGRRRRSPRGARSSAARSGSWSGASSASRSASSASSADPQLQRRLARAAGVEVGAGAEQQQLAGGDRRRGRRAPRRPAPAGAAPRRGGGARRAGPRSPAL